MIAMHCPGAQVSKAIFRTQPIQSRYTRHKLARGPIPPDQHHLARTRKTLTLRQTYFGDNVTTSGHTLEAARGALGTAESLSQIAEISPGTRAVPRPLRQRASPLDSRLSARAGLWLRTFPAPERIVSRTARQFLSTMRPQRWCFATAFALQPALRHAPCAGGFPVAGPRYARPPS
jgi:hypothetical protein